MTCPTDAVEIRNVWLTVAPRHARYSPPISIGEVLRNERSARVAWLCVHSANAGRRSHRNWLTIQLRRTVAQANSEVRR